MGPSDLAENSTPLATAAAQMLLPQLPAVPSAAQLVCMPPLQLLLPPPRQRQLPMRMTTDAHRHHTERFFKQLARLLPPKALFAAPPASTNAALVANIRQNAEPAVWQDACLEARTQLAHTTLGHTLGLPELFTGLQKAQPVSIRQLYSIGPWLKDVFVDIACICRNASALPEPIAYFGRSLGMVQRFVPRDSSDMRLRLLLLPMLQAIPYGPLDVVLPHWANSLLISANMCWRLLLRLQLLGQNGEQTITLLQRFYAAAEGPHGKPSAACMRQTQRSMKLAMCELDAMGQMLQRQQDRLTEAAGRCHILQRELDLAPAIGGSPARRAARLQPQSAQAMLQQWHEHIDQLNALQQGLLDYKSYFERTEQSCAAAVRQSNWPQ